MVTASYRGRVTQQRGSSVRQSKIKYKSSSRVSCLDLLTQFYIFCLLFYLIKPSALNVRDRHDTLGKTNHINSLSV